MQLLLHEVAHNAEQPLALGGLGLLGREFFRMGRGIIHYGREQDSPRRRQRQTRPPLVDAFGVCADAGHFVIGRSVVDFRQRQGDFDQLFGLGGHRFSILIGQEAFDPVYESKGVGVVEVKVLQIFISVHV